MFFLSNNLCLLIYQYIDVCQNSCFIVNDFNWCKFTDFTLPELSSHLMTFPTLIWPSIILIIYFFLYLSSANLHLSYSDDVLNHTLPFFLLPSLDASIVRELVSTWLTWHSLLSSSKLNFLYSPTNFSLSIHQCMPLRNHMLFFPRTNHMLLYQTVVIVDAFIRVKRKWDRGWVRSSRINMLACHGPANSNKK